MLHLFSASEQRDSFVGDSHMAWWYVVLRIVSSWQVHCQE